MLALCPSLLTIRSTSLAVPFMLHACAMADILVTCAREYPILWSLCVQCRLCPTFMKPFALTLRLTDSLSHLKLTAQHCHVLPLTMSLLTVPL